MRSTIKQYAIGAVIATGVAVSPFEVGIAAPLSVAGPNVVSAPQVTEQVRYRSYRHYRHYRRGNAIPGAVLGLFGAALGAAIANNAYNDDTYYYPGPYYYGGPAYYGGPVYRYGGRGFRGGHVFVGGHGFRGGGRGRRG